MKRGKTFIISGPSGVGKGSVLRVLLERRDNVYVSVSATTMATSRSADTKFPNPMFISFIGLLHILDLCCIYTLCNGGGYFCCC